ncbi:MAG: TonB-dependent receptor [Sphingomonadaceae bacterium]|nr:TonB-dependent receptor [Sphingomonadaceae bacterium]
MRKIELLCASALTMCVAAPAHAQDPADDPAIAVIVVTAQRQAESLQTVPIAVSAFDAEALERQQIENASDLQLSLPNVSFTKTNFTTSSFTIRGVGDLCTGTSCDSATAIHVNDMPLLATRLFETEYFDLERVEVLRGPQGTLFGRNATSGVVNFITARPDLSGFAASGSFEYGNYDSMRATGMVNFPIGDSFGIRVAGFYLNRDGYTENLFDNTRIDDRDLYAVRGSLRWEPGPDTSLDLVGYYFNEDDHRSRIQKQLCTRDPTGVLGCAPNALGNDIVNGNSTLAAMLSSQQLIGIRSRSAALAGLGLVNLYGPDQYQNASNPSDVRQVSIDYAPTYEADEWFAMGRFEHDFGSMALTVTGGYQETSVDSRTDYNLSVSDPFGINTGLFTLAALAGGAGGPGLAAYLGPAAAALIPNGPTGAVCVSEADFSYTGIFGGHVGGCDIRPVEFDRSASDARQWSVEAHVDSDFDGPFNFLLGGIYLDYENLQNPYFVNAYGLDYGAGIFGALTGLGSGGTLPPGFLAPPFFISDTDSFTLESWGIFGEAYVDFTDDIRLTVGARYSHDDKFVRARSPILSVYVPYGVTDATDILGTSFDADGQTPGQQPYREDSVSFGEITGRVVLEWQWSPDNLVYASYSRGYKSGGVNPPFDPVFSVQAQFRPEIINAFEIGSKNTIANGAVQLNVTAFYYDYSDLQLSRILNRTSFNDNTNAEVMGLELEAIISPDPAWLFNITGSLLHTRIGELFLVNTRDPSGGRDDVVIIKDITNAANCAIIPTIAGVPRGDAVVAAANGLINASAGGAYLQLATSPIPGTNTTGAYSICSTLAQVIAGGGLPYQVLFNSAGAPIGLPDGVAVDLSGNNLPLAPDMKISVGGQYTADFDNGMSLVLRADYTYTGEQWGRSFNDPVDRIDSYGVLNAQVQLNGVDNRWFVRAFVQNAFDNNAITGHYLTDPSSGLFTNIFTLEPRRYGLAAGFSF